MFHEPRVWTAIAFILFFVFFGRKLWKTIVKHLDIRAENIRRDLDEAARLRREAEQMLEDATREREKTLAEAQEMLARSEKEAANLAATARKEAEEAAARYEQMTRDRITAAERAAIREIQNKAAIIAIAATKEVIATRLSEDPSISKKLVNQSLQNLTESLRQSAA